VEFIKSQEFAPNTSSIANEKRICRGAASEAEGFAPPGKIDKKKKSCKGGGNLMSICVASIIDGRSFERRG